LNCATIDQGPWLLHFIVNPVDSVDFLVSAKNFGLQNPQLEPLSKHTVFRGKVTAKAGISTKWLEFFSKRLAIWR
jgi:hypothetical protein